MKQEKDVGKRFTELIGIMARLRGKEGCPWDREQTHLSLQPFLLEETYELLEAIEGEDSKAMAEELGDLLLQILFHCQIASEQGRFTADRVLSLLREKLIRRHPHVFSDGHLPDSQSVLHYWVKAKAQEEGTKRSPSLLGKLPKGMPALARSQRLGERASHLGFDWPETNQVWVKVEEELKELQGAIASGKKTQIKAELGDLLFSLVNVCRFLDIEAEEALHQSLNRFVDRFHYIERTIRRRGRTLDESSFEEMDSLWEEAKEKTTPSVKSGTPKRPGTNRISRPRRNRAVRKGPAKS